MLPLPKFIKPWKDAGEANALFAPGAFVDDHVFLMKTGALGVVFELSGIDSQCLTDATMDSNTTPRAPVFVRKTCSSINAHGANSAFPSPASFQGLMNLGSGSIVTPFRGIEQRQP